MTRLARTLSALVLICGIAACTEKGADNAQPQARQPGAAATGAASTPQENAQAMIRRYNQLLADGYRTLNMTPLQEVTTPELAQKAYYHMAAIGEGKSRMDSQLKKIDFEKSELPRPDRCQVQTREVWDYAYSDIATGKKLEAVSDYVYHVNYTVENKGGRWLITTIVANGDADSEKKVSRWDKLLNAGDKGAAKSAAKSGKPAGHP